VLFRFDPLDTFDTLDKRRPQMLAMDAVRADDQVVVYFDAPGFDLDDIDVTIENHAVTVEATRRWYDADQQTLTSERPQGSFRRQIQFGEQLDVEQLDATLDQGVLRLTIPVKEGSKPRKIEIESNDRTRQLETSS
jgi:HSP20 family protein